LRDFSIGEKAVEQGAPTLALIPAIVRLQIREGSRKTLFTDVIDRQDFYT
jgi:hypothetical protein